MDYPIALQNALPDYVTYELNRILGLPIENNRCMVSVNYDSLVTIRHAIISSDLVALAPSVALTRSLSHELSPLEISDWPMMEAEFGIVTKREIPRPPECESLISYLFEVAGEINSVKESWYT